MHETDRVSDHRAPGVQLTLRTASVDATRDLGRAIGAQLQPGDVLLLRGTLGAGKTALAQGVGAGLGVRGPINSPTFTLLKEYEGRVPLYHFDLYRIEDPAELESLGFDEYLEGPGVAVIEWPERGALGSGAGAWPPSWLQITLRAVGPDERELAFVARGTRPEQIVEALSRHVDSATTDRETEN